MKCYSRRPLQPLNGVQFPHTPPPLLTKPKPKHEAEQDKDKEKENLPFEPSLAQELSAFKNRLHRLREEHQKTEQLLKQRDLAMDLYMKQVHERCDFQKKLEIEVDRLFRLKELYAYSSRISPIRTLREREEERRSAISVQVIPRASDNEAITNENLEFHEQEEPPPMAAAKGQSVSE